MSTRLGVCSSCPQSRTTTTLRYYGPTEPTGHPGDKWGWAVQGALSIKNIPTGPGDVINMQAIYTDGASRYNFQSLCPQHHRDVWRHRHGWCLPEPRFRALLLTAVFARLGTGIETVKTWGFRGGYTHNWNPNWASAIYGGYARVAVRRYLPRQRSAPGVAAASSAQLGLTGTCNPDFNIGVIGVNTVWTPVKNLAFTADVNWTRLDQKYSGTDLRANRPCRVCQAGSCVRAEGPELRSRMLLRAQRNF